MPILFCKDCGNLLMMEYDAGSNVTMYCVTCPYRQVLNYYVKVVYARPEEENKPDSKFVDMQLQRSLMATTSEYCPKCGHPKAFFEQMQTRSADEPMTIFYKCCDPKCNHTWRE